MSPCHVLELFFVMRICHRHKVPGVTELTFWGQTVDKHIYTMSGLVSAQKKQKAWKEKESDDIRVESSRFADGFDVHCKRKRSQRWLQACAMGRCSCHKLRWGCLQVEQIFFGGWREHISLIYILRHLTGSIEYIVVYMNLDFWGRLWTEDKIWESSSCRWCLKL